MKEIINEFVKEFGVASKNIGFISEDKTLHFSKNILRDINEIYVPLYIFGLTKGVELNYNESIDYLSKNYRFVSNIGDGVCAIFNIDNEKLINYLSSHPIVSSLEAKIGKLSETITHLEQMTVLKMDDNFNKSNDKVAKVVSTIVNDIGTNVKDNIKCNLNELSGKIAVSMVDLSDRIRDINEYYHNPVYSENEDCTEEVISDDAMELLNIFAKDGCDIAENDKINHCWKIMKNNKIYAIISYDKLRINKDTIKLTGENDDTNSAEQKL